MTAGLEQVHSNTEKACIVSHYRKFSTNIKIKINNFVYNWFLTKAVMKLIC